MAKNKPTTRLRKIKKEIRDLRIQNKNEFESSPEFRKAKKHVLIGFLSFVIFLILVVKFSELNKELPTGVSMTGVVVDWAADGPKRRHAQLNAKIELENGFTFFIPFKNRKVGETLEFKEFKHKLTGNYKYRLKDQ